MGPILSKKQMTEEDIKLHYITPAIQSKWGLDRITMETRITDGRVNIKGNLVAREKPKKADYVLHLNQYKPIAIVEAKDNNHSISYGLQQAKLYALMLDVPFAYSSNGDGFQEYDFLTGKERTLTLTNSARTYNERLAEYEAERARQGATYIVDQSIRIGDNNNISNTNIVGGTGNKQENNTSSKKKFSEKHPILISVIVGLITGVVLLLSFWQDIVNWIEGLF